MSNTKTKKKFDASMFDTLKDALKKSEGSGGSFANIMKFPAGKTYTLRFIPNLESIADTFYHHYTNQWTSVATGKFISALSLTTFGERDPISEYRWKLYREWKDNPASKQLDDKGNPVRFNGPIQQKEQWYANIYVVEDPSDPENNGTVKVLKIGPQLMGIIKDAMEGDRSDEFGAAIFDLSSDGADFKIKAVKKGEFTSFETSFFTKKSDLDLDEDEIEKIYESVHDLKQIQPAKSFEDLQTLLQEHFLCDDVDSSDTVKEQRKPLTAKNTAPVKKETKKVVVEEPEDEIPMEFGTDASEEDDIDELLAGLDD